MWRGVGAFFQGHAGKEFATVDYLGREFFF